MSPTDWISMGNELRAEAKALKSQLALTLVVKRSTAQEAKPC